MQKNKESVIKSTIILFTITSISAFLLAFIYVKTKQKIKLTEKQKKLKAYEYIFPNCSFSEEKQIENIPYVKVYDNKKKLKGFIVFAQGNGYSSTIQIAFGITMDKKIKAIKILYQQETPGLGARCEEVKKTETIFDILSKKKNEKKKIQRPWFQKQYENLSLDEIYLKKLNPKGKIEAITGATITSNAITKAIHKNMEIFLKHFDELTKNK